MVTKFQNAKRASQLYQKENSCAEADKAKYSLAQVDKAAVTCHLFC